MTDKTHNPISAALEDAAVIDRLMTDFYTSRFYDPKAARPADTVKAAMAFAVAAILHVTEGDGPKPRISCAACKGNGYSGGTIPTQPDLCDACEECSGSGSQLIKDWQFWMRDAASILRENGQNQHADRLDGIFAAFKEAVE